MWRAIEAAQLWPFTSGTVRCRVGENATMLLSQLPYVPLGDLRTVVSYPHPSGVIPDETLCAALESVALPRYTDRLDEVNDWAKVLSPGEQERVAFARILLTKPKVVFLDEATSVGASRATRDDQHLELLGDGQWRFGPIGARPYRPRCANYR